MARPRQFDEEDVIRKATDLFWTKGYRDTTPRDLLKATGLSKSSLYATFGSKQGLFERAIEAYVDQQERFLASMLSGGDLRSALGRMYTMFIEQSARAGGRSCLVCTAAVEVARDEPSLMNRIARARDRVEVLLAARITQAQEAGEVSADRDPVALARFIYSNNMGIAVLALSLIHISEPTRPY